MDEILIANFMLFQEIVQEDDYDLILADEAWDVDYFWHEHPELKRAPLALVHRLRRLPADAREGRARRLPDRRLQRRDDRAYRGRAGLARSRDLRRQPGRLRRHQMGPNLPGIRAWTETHFASAATSSARTRDFGRTRNCAQRSASIGRAGLHRHGRRFGRRRPSASARAVRLSDRQRRFPDFA